MAELGTARVELRVGGVAGKNAFLTLPIVEDRGLGLFVLRVNKREAEMFKAVGFKVIGSRVMLWADQFFTGGQHG